MSDDKEVKVVHVYNGKAVKVKKTIANIFKRFKPKSKVEVIPNKD